MNYLFFDIECADGGQATICSFGYCICDSNFKILKREDIIINPEGRFYLAGRAGRPDIVLAYPEARFFRAPTFPKFHKKIKDLLENENYYIIGHSIGDDANYLNRACKRYNLEPLSFTFFDTQRMYREITGEKRPKSLEKALLAFGIEEKFRAHQSVEDARATMLLLKAMLEKVGKTFEEYLASTNHCTGKTKEGVYEWEYSVVESVQSGVGRRNRLRPEKEGQENCILRGRKNHILFLRYLDYGEGIGERGDLLAGKRVCISMNYECNHFKEMLILAGRIKALGGEYVIKGSTADIFATYEMFNEDGTPRHCSRLAYIEAEIEAGKEIEVVSFDDLLATLGLTREALEEMTPPDVEYLSDAQYVGKIPPLEAS